MNTPKPGDTRVCGSCPRCGGQLIEEYSSFSVYHNDVEWGWRDAHHDLNSCVSVLAKKIYALEKALKAIQKGSKK